MISDRKRHLLPASAKETDLCLTAPKAKGWSDKTFPAGYRQPAGRTIYPTVNLERLDTYSVSSNDWALLVALKAISAKTPMMA